MSRERAALNPNGAQRRTRWWQAIGSALFIILVLALMVRGLLASTGWLRWPFNDLLRGNDIQVESIGGDYVLFMARRDAAREIRLLNWASGAVLDISKGDARVSHVAMAPQGDRLAYALADKSGSVLISRGMTETLTITVFAGPALSTVYGSALSEPVAICEGSDLYWSPQGKYIAFFACDKDQSALFVVETKPDARPVTVPDTLASAGIARKVAWVEEGKLAYTAGSKEPSLALFDVESKSSQILYGPLR